MGLWTTLKREYHFLSNALRVLGSVKSVDAESNHLVADEIEALVDKFGKNTAFIENGFLTA